MPNEKAITPQGDAVDARARQTAHAVRRQIAALAIFGLLVLAFWLWRAGWHNVFARGWWRW